MQIQKLNWAGIKLTCNDQTILIDAVENFKPYFAVLGEPQTPLIPFTDETKADYILFTHLHLDHFDTGVIDKCLKPDGKLICYSKLQPVISRLYERVIYLDTNEVFEENGIVFKAAFSLDGIGEEQTAWIISDNDTKIFHGGDTIWHNQFWKTGKENENIDYAFLPVNGVVVNFQMVGLEYSSVPAAMTLEQAFNAAKLLHARELIPIHYGKFATKYYQPDDLTSADFAQQAEKTGQAYRIVEDGQLITK